MYTGDWNGSPFANSYASIVTYGLIFCTVSEVIISDYWSNFRCRQGLPVLTNMVGGELLNSKNVINYGFKKLETSL